MSSPGPLIRLDPCIALADLFQVRSRHTPEADVMLSGGNPRQDHVRLELLGPLSAFDQGVYFGVHRLAAESDQPVEGAGDAADVESIRRALKTTDRLEGCDVAAVTCSWRGLARAAGHNSLGKSTQEQLRRSLDKLAMTRLTTFAGPIPIGGSQLIAWEERSRLMLLLNPRAAECLREPRRPDGRPRHVAFISLHERALLRPFGDEALIAHAWLSAWAWSGKARDSVISRRRLADHIWADDPPGSTRRRRERRLDVLLDEISSLPGWHVTYDDGMVRVRRDARRNALEQRATAEGITAGCGAEAPECGTDAQ